MKKNKYKIVVLSDLKDSTGITLKSTVSLAKMINGDIEFFHVKSPRDIVERDNQLSAFRNYNQKHLATEKKIKSIISPIADLYNIDISYNFSFGNVKNEIGKYLKEAQPDIIVLGKRKPKMLKFIGDSITPFILKNHDGVVMIASDTNALEPNKELSLGVLNGVDQTSDIAFADDLMSHTQMPLKAFKIIKKSNESEGTTSINNKNLVEYVFEEGDNAISNLSKYLSVSNTNLLFVDRFNGKKPKRKRMLDLDIETVLDSLNVSLLLGSGKISFNNN